MKTYVFLLFVLFATMVSAQQATGQIVKINELVEGTLLEAESNPKDYLAILVAEKGMTDRDGNQPMLKSNSLKKLAQALAQDGISSFRYDKRILKLVEKNMLDEGSLRFDDLVADAIRIVNYFQNKGYSKIIVIGHDQGALIGSIAASKTSVDKIITISGAGSTIDRVIVEKIKQEAPELAPSAEKAFEEMRQTGMAKQYDPALESIFRETIQPFIKSWMAYDPAEVLSKLDIPVLVINAKKDMQSLPIDAVNLTAKTPAAVVVAIPNMNHVLTDISDDNLENGKSYNEPDRPLSPEMINTIKAFIKK
ncbi:MAG: alpha/beta fold hydrolase [Leeuwenhoekiella sp.]